nr:hypothetical protein [Tanacetum cinerariifolium]
MLDAYTSSMCQISWGKNDYARALIEVSSLNPMKDSVMVAIPFPDGLGHSLKTVKIEYEWTPPLCETCKFFDHDNKECPKNVKVQAATVEEADGFTKVTRKNGKKKQNMAKQVAGIKFSKPKVIFYKVVEKQPNKEGSGSSNPIPDKPMEYPKQKDPTSSFVLMKNSFETLMNHETDLGNMYFQTATVINDDEEEVKNVYDEYGIITCCSADKKNLFCSIVYAHNRYIQRRELWKNLSIHKHYVRDRPWCILGDFNVSLSTDESSSGSSRIRTGMHDFQECVDMIEVTDVNSTSLHFTWNQKPKGEYGILKKIDRVMANLEFLSLFAGACAIFQPYRISDHAPTILRLPMSCAKKPNPFKFYNLFIQNPLFKDVINQGWKVHVSGFWMFKVVKCLKYLKKPLRGLLYAKGSIHDNVIKLCHELDEKAKIDWLKLGDANTAYFHKVVKSQASRNRIDSIKNMDGNIVNGDQLSVGDAESMVRDVTNDEIKEALFSLG